ncbi:MAG: hypothetical protein KGH71_01575 [Candidatus Micrarchaeota archaeon]|nr:hypothetical protein [Candidatus Micrarchaeota archaeon]
MFGTKRPSDSSKQIESSLNLVARNTLDKENSLLFDRKKFYTPFDSRFYDAFASFLIWNSLPQGSPNQLIHYFSNGYNRDVRFIDENGIKHTASEFVLEVYRSASRDVIKEGLEPAVKYIDDHTRIPISSSRPPQFMVLRHDRSGKELVLITHYLADDYNCRMSLHGRHWSIQEFIRGARRA